MPASKINYYLGQILDSRISGKLILRLNLDSRISGKSSLETALLSTSIFVLYLRRLNKYINNYLEKRTAHVRLHVPVVERHYADQALQGGNANVGVR